MNILIDINHPAQLHYFRNLYCELSKRHRLIVTTKNIPSVLALLDHYEIPYVNIGDKGIGIFDKVCRQIVFTERVRKIILNERIDIAIGVSSKAVHASLLNKCKSIFFLDDDLSVLSAVAPYTMPFINTGLSPDVLEFERTPRVLYYPGFQELAYLHPNRFTPNPDVPIKYGLRKDEKYFMLRFNAFTAHHDRKNCGLSLTQKRQLVAILSKHGRVFITTEAKLNPEFDVYRMPISSHEIHDFLYFSQMLVSDSQTMSSEAAVLGVPSFRCNTFVGKISYLEEEEKRYGLTYGYLPNQFAWMIDRIEHLLNKPNLKETWQIKRAKMLRDKIDVTAFWLWFIENYPASVRAVKEKDFRYDQFR